MENQIQKKIPNQFGLVRHQPMSHKEAALAKGLIMHVEYAKERLKQIEQGLPDTFEREEVQKRVRNISKLSKADKIKVNFIGKILEFAAIAKKIFK